LPLSKLSADTSSTNIIISFMLLRSFDCTFSLFTVCKENQKIMKFNISMKLKSYTNKFRLMTQDNTTEDREILQGRRCRWRLKTMNVNNKKFQVPVYLFVTVSSSLLLFLVTNDKGNEAKMTFWCHCTYYCVFMRHFFSYLYVTSPFLCCVFKLLNKKRQ